MGQKKEQKMAGRMNQGMNRKVKITDILRVCTNCGKNIKKSMTALILSFVMVLSIMQQIDGSVPKKVMAETVVGRADLTFNYANVKSGESDYDAFVRIGREFYNTYIKGKYTSTGAKNGGTEKVFTQESVYAMEYAMNKDILSDDAVSKLTSGSTKVVDLPTYGEKVNVFCAETLDKMPEARKSTNAPNDQNYNAAVGEAEREWAVAGKGIATPDFDSLALTGKNLLGCGNAYDLLQHYAVLDKNALWNGNYNSYNRLVNADGNLILGWVKLPGGQITVQACYSFSLSDLSQFYNTTGYGFVMSDNRYYLIKDNILQTKNTTINFAKDFSLENANWYEEGSAENRNLTWVVDACCGVSDEDIEDVVGAQNYLYMNLSETIAFQKLFSVSDISLPMTRGAEYGSTITLRNTGALSINMEALSTKQLSLNVTGDTDGWYQNHLFFSSSNDKVATVDNTGRVYGISEGDTVITAVAKTSGRSVPVQIKVHVTGSPNIRTKVPVGVFTEDAVFPGGAEVALDNLPANMEADGAAAVIIVEQGIFTVNGKRDYDPTASIGAGDVLKYERWTQTAGLGTLPFEEYKRLADKLHKMGKKLYLVPASFYGVNFAAGVSDEAYRNRMINAYITNPSNAEAKRFVDKMFNAWKSYYTQYAASYTKAGVDGFYINDATLGNQGIYINDGHWSQLIASIRSVYSGEIKASVTADTSMTEAMLNNDDLFSNVDSILVTEFGETQDHIEGEYPSVKECKTVMQEYIGTFTDALYEKYGKTIDVNWCLTSTVHCASSHGDGTAGKGRWHYNNYVDHTTNYTTVDYLQQMLTFEAALELYSEKEYTGTIYSRYYFQGWKCQNQCYDLRSGYDCSANIYQKPASKLLAAWSTGKSPQEADPTKACRIGNISGEEMTYSFYTMKDGDDAQINMSPDNIDYTYLSSDTSVVSVAGDGTMTAQKAGKVKVTVRAVDGTYGTKSFTVYVFPAGRTNPDRAAEQYDRVLAALGKWKGRGQEVTAGTLYLFYELAARINEPMFTETEISEMVDGGIFDYSTKRQYTEFVLGLRSYEDDITLNDLKVSGNTVCKCTTNDEYIYDYALKNPYDANFYTDGSWEDNNGNIEIIRPDGKLIYGWNDFGSDVLGVVPQYLAGGNINKCALYGSHMIHTGDRFYFVHAWDVDRDNITLRIDEKDVQIPLETDGGITESKMKTVMSEALGEDYYAEMLADLKNGVEKSFQSVSSANTEGGNEYSLIQLNIGYPTDKIFDFACDNITYDGKTTFTPKVTRNYSGGEVTFSYQRSDSYTWSEKAPTEPGTYTVRATVAPNNGYRKLVSEKTAKIMGVKAADSQSVPPASVNAVKDGQSVKVTWPAVNSANRYKVQKRIGSGNWDTLAYTSGLSYMDSDCCGQEVSYRVCARVNGAYSAGSTESAKIKVPHVLNHVAAAAPTMEKPGNIEYYRCSYCGKYFSDAAGTKEITAGSVVLYYVKDAKALLKAGATVTDTASKAVYKVTKPATVAAGSNAVTPGEVAYKNPADKKAASVNIPESIRVANGEVYNVTAIGDKAFENCKKLKNVTIPSTVTSIGKAAFKKCTKMTKAVIGKEVVTLGTSAFEGDTALKTVTFKGTTVETIGDSAFKGCKKLTSIIIPKAVKTIGKNAFNGCKKLKKITFKGANVKKIGKTAFKGVPKKATAKVPKKKLKDYKKLLKKAKFTGKVKK